MVVEHDVPLPVAAGQNATVDFVVPPLSTALLGIYHVDYILLDAQGNVIQPQAETDSGRFVVSTPPPTQTVSKDIWFSISSPTQEVFFNEPFVYTFHVFNTTSMPRNLTIKTWLPHTNRRHEWSVTANPNGETTVTGSDLFLDSRYMFETLRAYLYDESGAQIGSYMLSFKGLYPKVTVTTSPGKGMYARGETVNLSVNLKNTQNAAAAVKLGVTVTDPSNLAVYANAPEVALPAGGTSIQPLSFALPTDAQGGLYTVSSEVYDGTGKKVGGDATSFDIPLRFVTVAPNIPAALNPGANTVSFALGNLGVLPVSSGVLDVNLKDPDGVAVASLSQLFTLDAGQSKGIDLSVSIPPLKFGAYTLSYTQSDETKAGKSATVTLPNTALIAATFDKASYRVRETANLALALTNTGRFNLDGLSVTVSAPDAGYSATETVNLAANQSMPLNRALPTPETIAAGQHAVTVTLTLPGSSVTSKGFTITVPDSLLSFSLGQSNVTAGGAVTATFANTGGKDTTAEYRLTLYDAKSAQIADKSATEAVQAGGTLTLSLPIPVGAADGGYTLVVNYRDTKTGKAEIVQKPLTVTGVKAALTLQSDKQTYLGTENITSLSGVTNSGTLLQGGNLHLQVSTAAGSQKQKTWTSKFDIQQGIRDGVDTHGVNDWLIPDDDFSVTTIDADKWSLYGNVSSQSGKIVIDSSAVEASATSKWQLDGDFDLQVDFSSNNSVQNQGAQFDIYNGSVLVFIKNTKQEGYISGIWINGDYKSWRMTGSYASSGRFRITRTATTVVTYYWSGSSWVEVHRGTYPELTQPIPARLLLWRGAGYAGANTAFDNFMLNSGRLVNQEQTVDSVRLLPMNDNFDDGLVNTDRWSVRSSGSVATNESNGVLVTADTQTGIQSYANVAGHFPLEGDFDISIGWKMPVAPASGDWGSIFQINAVDQNTVPDNRLVGNAIQIKRSYINGVGHTYYTGRFNGTFWDAWGGPVTTGDTSGRFRIKRMGSTVTVWYWNSGLNRWEWNGNTAGYTWANAWTTPCYIQIGVPNNVPNRPLVKTDWNNFNVSNGAAYTSNGTIRLKQDAGRISNWQALTWGSTQPVGTSIRFRTRTAADEAGLGSATWSDYLTASGAPVTSPPGRWIEIEATLSTTSASVTPLLNDVSVTYGNNPGDIVWQADVPVNLAQGALFDLTNTIGTIGTAGKYYLQGALNSSTGQTVSTAEYPFYVAQGNTTLSVNPDRKTCKPGEMVTISGEVKNLATVDATNLTLTIKGQPSGGAEQTLDIETFTIPAGGSRPFTVTTTAGAEGTVTLTGTVTQNGSTLAQISDQYEIAAPKVTATLTVPDVAGNDPFTVSLQLTNSGKTDAAVAVGKSFASLSETVIVPAGQTRLLQYTQQITADASYAFTMTGDLAQTVVKTVKYGPAATVALAPSTLYPEGKVTLPATISNTGLLDGQFAVTYQLAQGPNAANQQVATYYIPKGGSTTDTLSFDLVEGSYQLTAAGQLPTMSATTSFSVRKEVKADLAMTVGTQSGILLPVAANITNLGYNAITGTVRLSLIDANGAAAWSAAQDVSLPQALVPSPQSLPFTINLSAIKPGNYTIKGELLDAGNRQLAVQTAPFTFLGPVFEITQVPPFQAIPAGGNATMTFKVKNSGNQEGNFDLSFKADDLIDSTQTAWLKPGEEKEIAFTFQTATDLEEKDYFAAYNLKQQGSGNGERGTVKYRLAGIKLAVSATLDRQTYNVGDTANLTLTITQQDAGAAPNLFARVNYNGYEEKRDFSLNGSPLTFAVPLPQITGEKLFYGIYHESGRSIHLNTIYIHKAGDALTITTDKQVYNPDETVTASLTGTAGDLTMTGPGDFSNTFVFTGSDSRSFILPSTMTAGTYYLNAQLKTQNSELITVSCPFDVAGIQVKVKEALLDKAKYASTDTMKLTLTIESNKDMPATLKTWIVDPAGSYTPAGEGAVELSAVQPLLATQNSKLETASLGIHKLVYGIYQGDLLLASGAKAFDVGEAVLLGLSTDKSDYPTNDVPVVVKTDLFGAASANLELLLDGNSIKSDPVNLAGFSTNTQTLLPESLTPGPHKLKAVLTSGGLTSVKETGFVYGSSLPDLTARLSSEAAKGSTVALACTVTNQGKTDAVQSALTLYDGDPASGGTAITSLAVPALEPGASTTLTYNWSVLGKAGDHVIYALADSGNAVTEFIEGNNTSLSPVSLPNLSLAVTAGNSNYKANEEAGIAASLANLTSNVTYTNGNLRLELSDPSGGTTVLADKAVATLSPATETAIVTGWNTGSSMPGTYILKGRLTSGAAELVTQSATFAIDPTPSLVGSLTLDKQEVIQGFPLTIGYTVTNNGNIDLPGGEVTAEFIEKGSGSTAKTVSQTVPFVSVMQSISQAFNVEKVDIQPGDYMVKLAALASGTSFLIGERPLKVLPPLEVTKGLSLSPRVLVLVGSDTANMAQKTAEEISVENLVSQALEGMGGFYRIVSDVQAFKGELRTGHYNAYILSGSRPLTDHLDEELRERVHGGDGLVLLNYEKMDDVKFRELPGVKGIGYFNGPTTRLDLFESLITQPGSYQVAGKARKVAVESPLALVAAVLYEGSKTSPAVILNPYGTGKVVTFTFMPGASLLHDAAAYAVPRQVEVTAATPLPVETVLKSFGAGFELKVREEAAAGLPLLLAIPAAETAENAAVWQFSLMKDETKKLLVLRKLPEEGGTFDLATSVDFLNGGIYQPYKACQLSITVDKGVVALTSGIHEGLKTLPVTVKDLNKLPAIINAYENILNRPLVSANDAERTIKDLLFIIGEVRSLAVDTLAIRLDLDRLLKVYEMKWVELPR